MPSKRQGLDLGSGEKERTEIHDMVATDGTIIDDDVCPNVRPAQQNAGSDAYPKPTALQHSTKEISECDDKE